MAKRKGKNKKFNARKGDVQFNCDELVLDVFYRWLKASPPGSHNPDDDKVLVCRLKKVRTRFVENI